MSSPSDLGLIEARTLTLSAGVNNKTPTTHAIRESRAKLTGTSLRRLREELFKRQLQLLQDMVTNGIDNARLVAASHCARAIEVVEVLQVGARER